MKRYRVNIVHIVASLALISAFAFAEPRATSPEDSPPTYGHAIQPAEARAGWISLFDGQSTFGWTDEAVVQKGILRGGATTMKFGDYQLRADVIAAGKLTVGKGRMIETLAGIFECTVEGSGPGPIRMNPSLAVRSLAIRPLGLKTVFDGKTFEGWKRIQRTPAGETPLAKWSLEDGALRAVGGPEVVELENSRYGDFVLQLSIKTHRPRANGGLFFRAIPGDFMNGYEAQIHNVLVHNIPGGLLHVGTGGIDDRQENRRLVSRDGELFTMTIIAVGPRICTWVNGDQLVDWTDRRDPHHNPRVGLRVEPGALQLQAHDPETDLEFRDIRIGEIQ